MGLFKRISGLLGLGKDEEQQRHDDAAADAAVPASSPVAAPAEAFASAQHLPRRGFSVPVHVPIERAPPPPLLVFCPAEDGGVQGLRWYSKLLRIDEDGDIADEFLDEVSTDMEEHDKSYPRFKVKYSTRPAQVKNIALLPNGQIQHLVECQGKLEWL